MTRRHLGSALAAAALALAGCGSADDREAAPGGQNPGTAQVSAGGADPCALVTAAEVGAIIGEPIRAKAASGGGCVYQTADPAASSVRLDLDQADAAAAMEAQRRAVQALGGIGDAASGEGGAGASLDAALGEGGNAPKLGDEALFGPNAQLSVRKGGSYLAVTPPTMRSRTLAGNPMLAAEDRRRMAVAIAEKALARLP